MQPLEARTLLAIRPLDTVIDPTAGNAVPLNVQDVAQSAAHGSVVAGTSGQTVQVRRFGSDGKPIGSSVRADESGGDPPSSVRVAINASGQSVVAWQSISAPKPQPYESVHARVFNADGSEASGVIEVYAPASEADIQNLHLGMADDGRFVVCFSSFNGQSAAQLNMAGYKSDGTQFAYAGSNVNPDTYFPSPAVAMLPDGAFALASTITSHDQIAGYTSVVQVSVYDKNGGYSGGGTLSDPSQEPSVPQIAPLGEHGFVVTWEDQTGDAGVTIHFKTLSDAGVRQPADHVVAAGLPTRTLPTIAADAIGNFTIGWSNNSEQLRSFDRDLRPTSDTSPVADADPRQLDRLVYFGGGTFADLATIIPNVGTPHVAINAYANVLTIDGSARADKIALNPSGSGDAQAFNLSQNGSSKAVRLDAYASIDVNLQGGDDSFSTSMPLPTVLHAGDGNDRVTLASSNDTIYGEGGNDTLSAGDGSDYVSGGDGNDLLRAGAGNDNVVGGAGKNRLYGDAGDDRIVGSRGPDLLDGGDGADRLYGDAGDDQLFGDGGTDRLYGGDGQDSLVGGSSIDRLYGEAGDDTLAGGSGRDYLFGGVGTDTRGDEDASDVVDSVEVTA